MHHYIPTLSAIPAGKDMFVACKTNHKRRGVKRLARYWSEKLGVRFMCKDTDEGVWVFNMEGI